MPTIRKGCFRSPGYKLDGSPLVYISKNWKSFVITKASVLDQTKVPVRIPFAETDNIIVYPRFCYYTNRFLISSPATSYLFNHKIGNYELVFFTNVNTINSTGLSAAYEASYYENITINVRDEFTTGFPIIPTDISDAKTYGDRYQGGDYLVVTEVNDSSLYPYFYQNDGTSLPLTVASLGVNSNLFTKHVAQLNLMQGAFNRVKGIVYFNETTGRPSDVHDAIKSYYSTAVGGISNFEFRSVANSAAIAAASLADITAFYP